MPSIVRVDVDFLRADGSQKRSDAVAVEEPLEIRIAGETLAITMRTPGSDRELVLGFLLAEGIIARAADVSTIAHCGKTGDEARENTIEVTLAPGVRAPIDLETGHLARRGTIVSSACGVCGRQSIDDLLARVTALPAGPAPTRAAIARAVEELRTQQPVFAETGGCHAASLVRFDGSHVATFEDVGRHNAVDKVIGSQVRVDKTPLREHMLVVSGRSSFEIVQKATCAGIPVVVSVSAASSLAIDLARRANLTLCGFARDDRLTIYSGALGHAAAASR
jgi:FdhD protein